jgi:uncharacterized membrane protein YcjF (UPF0283 family)
MLLAAEYPLLQVFWTILIFFAWVAWIWMVVTVLADVFRRHDLSGWGKAAWSLFIIVVPFFGVLTYLIANSREMAERQAREAEAAQARFDDHVRSVADGGGAAAEIEKADRLLQRGSIDQSEYDSIKARALAQPVA